MPATSDLLDAETLAAIEAAAVDLDIKARQAVVLVERLVTLGVLGATLAPSLAPEAEARLALTRFRSAIPQDDAE